MATVAQRFDEAWKLQQAGTLDRAEQLYRDVLADEPNHADSWHLLGVTLLQRGRHGEAVDALRRAVAINPAQPAYHNHLGAALGSAGRMDEAVTSLREAVRLQPADAQAHYNLANALGSLKRTEEAAAAYQEAIRRQPNFPEAWFNFGNLCRENGRLDDAVAAYRQAILLRPNYLLAVNNLGNTLYTQYKLDEAAAAFEEALRIKPDYVKALLNLGVVRTDQGRIESAVDIFHEVVAREPTAEALNNLGRALSAQQRLDEAAQSFEQALEKNPDYLTARANLGAVHTDQGRLDSALGIFHHILAHHPDSAEAHNNLGVALMKQGKLNEALSSIQRAVELDPEYIEARKNRGVCRMFMGNFVEGWPEFEWRWKSKDYAPHNYRQPLWDGSSLVGRTILLHAEQGLGDTLQFIRYALLVKERAGTVIVHCQPALKQLLRTTPGIDQLLPQDTPAPDADVQAPLMSLPALVKSPGNSVPANVPYLFAEPKLFEQWRARIRTEKGLNVGIAWQGNPKYRGDKFRSIPLAEFAALAEVPGVRLISLQKGLGSEQIAEIADRFAVVDYGDELDAAGPFLDTAAVMMNLDLVITSDTAMAHLAGGLGVPVWVALPWAPDWRWLLDRDDCPWYPTMRLFRQTQGGPWSDVFQRMAAELRDRFGAATK